MFAKILINTIQNAMQKYQDHDLVKPTNMNTLQVILYPHQSRIEKARFTYASLGKPFEKQVKLLKSKEKTNLTFYNLQSLLINIKKQNLKMSFQV